MLWDTTRMVEFNRQALVRLVAGLFVTVGVAPGTSSVATLPRHLRSAILFVLRPAESATRRLAMVLARRLPVLAYVRRAARSGSGVKRTGKKRAVRNPRFRLIDPRKDFAELHPNRKPPRPKHRGKDGVEPHLLYRIAGFDGRPDFEAWSEGKPALCADDPVPALLLCRRMQALHHALADLPKQAQRLAREMAKRAVAPPGPGRVPPLRGGLPPGYRQRPVHEVDEILRDCHFLARQEPEPPDIH